MAPIQVLPSASSAGWPSAEKLTFALQELEKGGSSQGLSPEKESVISTEPQASSCSVISPEPETEKLSAPYYHVFQPNTKNVVCGGFDPLKENVRPSSRTLRGYPPPSNSAYQLTSNGHFPSLPKRNYERFDVNPSISLLARNRTPTETLVQPEAGDIRPKIDGTDDGPCVASTSNPPEHIERDSNGQTLGERLADAINWDRPCWVMTTPGVSGMIYDADEQREDFIKNIDSGAEFEFCKKCQKKHIPPGGPITLQDRDTCGSYLPEWFNTEGVEQPWAAFRQIWNEIIILDEMEMGFNHRPDPSKPMWDLEFHEKHPKWREIGRREGWWKCRSGPNASAVEKKCKLCHNPKTEDGEAAITERNIPISVRKQAIMNYILKMVTEGGLKDRAAVEERARREGIPLHLGSPLTQEQVMNIERQRSALGLFRTGSDSTISTISTLNLDGPADNEGSTISAPLSRSSSFWIV